MDLHLTRNEPSDAEREAIDAVLGVPADRTAVERAATGQLLRAERGGQAIRDRRHLLLPALLALVERVGWVSPEGLDHLSRRLGVAPAEVYGVASFYALIPLEARPTATVAHVCVDLACRLAEGAAGHRGRWDADPTVTVVDSPCLGQCDRAPATLVSEPGAPARQRVETAAEATATAIAQCGEPGLRLLRRIDVIDPTDLGAYLAHGGYAALDRALDLGPAGVVDEIVAAGLVGRGGAAFPTGRKWAAVAAQAAHPHHLVCNADESEPGTFKDRVVLEGDPFAVIEAMTIAAYATGCEHGWIYLRGEYPVARERLGTAIGLARDRGLLGPDVLGRGFAFDLEVFSGAGAYICGEETAIFNSIEGYRGEPRSKPPFPVEVGLFGRPTLVNNVETLVNVLPVLTEGAVAYRSIGTAQSPGPKLFCLSGSVRRPGVYEVPFGTTLGELIELAGGLPAGRTVQAVLLGGAAGTFVGPEHLSLPLTFEDTRAAGTTVGSGVVLVIDDRADLVDLVGRIAAFFRDESCGQCVPCRVGTVRQEEALVRLRTGRDDRTHQYGRSERDRDLALLDEVGRAMRDASICGLGQTAWNAIESALTRFSLFREDEP